MTALLPSSSATAHRAGTGPVAGTAARPRRSWCVRDWWRVDRGSAAAEVTLVAPLLILMLVLVAVLVHRGVTARLQLDAAAHQAARAAALTRSAAAADTAARTVATGATAATGPACRSVTATTDTSRMRPGGTVTVTLTCAVDLSDALPQGLLKAAELSASATEPIDTFRRVDGGIP